MFYNFKFKYQHFFIICLYHQTQLSMSSFAFRAHRHAQLGQIPVEAGKLRIGNMEDFFLTFSNWSKSLFTFGIINQSSPLRLPKNTFGTSLDLFSGSGFLYFYNISILQTTSLLNFKSSTFTFFVTLSASFSFPVIVLLSFKK